MSGRNWRVLLIILAVLVIYVVFVERPFTDDVRGPAKKKTLMFKNFDPAQATAIEIKSGGKTSRLEKNGGTWIVASDGGFAAEAKAVSDLLAKVDTLQTGPIMSQNQEKRSTFGVDTSGVEVQFFGGSNSLAHFWVGKSTPDFSGLFVRVDGSNDVYGLSGINRYLFDRGAQTWRERKLVPFDAEAVSKLVVSYADTSITYTREGTDSLKTSSWSIAGNLPDMKSAPAIPEAVRPMITSAAGLMADNFPAPTDTIPTVWSPLAMKIDVEAKGGDRVSIEFGPKNKTGQYFVRKSGQPAVYLMGTWRTTRFQKHYRDMLKPEVTPAAATGAP